MSAEGQILVAGIGNIFLGDDAFGCEVVRRLAQRALPADVRVVDYGIRGLDLSYALLEPWRAAILIDTAARGGAPGTLYVLEPEAPDLTDAAPILVEAHDMDPVKVLQIARQLGGTIAHVLIVGCEPESFGTDEDPAEGLSSPVAASVEPAVALVEELLGKLGGAAHA